MISNFERISYFLICITLLTIYNEGCIIAQQRPKVGVVLSGGGARGLAHIGVLKVLEEAGIQPDYITGTSMGGIIAGLYASGYSATDISKLNASINWEYILSKNVPLNQIDMDEKEMYGKSILAFPIIDGKPSLPSGFIEGQKLSELISGLTWNTAGINNFDSLTIPFQCPVTNLVTSEVLILDTGNLASAMRATMSIPMIFTPYRIDSTTLLVDGGIMRNFPVQDVIDMGADIVIGAYVGYYTKKTANDYKSMQSILTRTANIAGASDVIKQLDLPDILITPDLNGFSGTNFSKNKQIEKKGEEAALKKIELLTSLADSINKLGPPKAKKVLPLNDSLFIQKIKIENCISTSPEFIISRSSLTENTWITRTEIDKAIGQVFGTLYYDNITYRFEKAGDNFNLIISVLEKPRSYIKMAVHYDNYYSGGLMLGYTKRDLFIRHSRVNIVADITPYPQFNIDYDKYFGLKQKTIVSFQFISGRNKIPVPMVDLHSKTINEYRFEIGLKASQSFGINQLAGIGISEEYSSIYPTPDIRESAPEWNFTNYDIHNLKLKSFYLINHLDNLIYPTSGLYMNFDITANLISHHFFSDQIDTVDYQMLELQSNSYQKISLVIDYYLPVTQNIILSSGLYVGLSNKKIPITDKFYAGGCIYNLRKRQTSFLGLNPNEITTNNLITMNFGVKFKIKSTIYIHGITNWLSRGESIQELSDQIRLHNNNNILGFGTGLTYKSFMGPICFLTGWNTMDNKPRYYLNLGFNF